MVGRRGNGEAPSLGEGRGANRAWAVLVSTVCKREGSERSISAKRITRSQTWRSGFIDEPTVYPTVYPEDR